VAPAPPHVAPIAAQLGGSIAIVARMLIEINKYGILYFSGFFLPNPQPLAEINEVELRKTLILENKQLRQLS